MNMDVLVSLSKRRGFVFQSSEIYGGTGSVWDYGPLGVELKNNIKRVWWRDFVQNRADMVGIDASILMHPTVWKASGHLEHFTDPMVDCRECKHRFRADHVDALPWVHYCPATKGNKFTIPAGEPCGHCGQRRTLCPACGKGELTAPRQFNLMFKTFMGPVEEDAAVTYLRPETAQAMFVNFDNVLQSMRLKLPFGIAQAGRSFRNEITPGNFIFRTREFEQMEIEYFVNPNDRVDGRPADEYWHDRWIDDCMTWFRRYGLAADNLRLREHEKDELAHYAKRTVDIEYKFPIGWSELMGIANRADLAKHWRVVYDDTAAIGRLYRRQDEVGTPYCVTVDVQTVEDGERGETGDSRVTIRERDSMEQIRVPIAELTPVFRELLDGAPWSQVSGRYPAPAAKASGL